MPTSMKDLLTTLIDQLGLHQRAALQALSASYAAAVPPRILQATRLTTFRNGVLEIEVLAAPVLMELKLYHQQALLRQLRQDHPGLRALRFRPSGRGAPPSASRP